MIDQITIRERRFGVEPELTAKISRLRDRPRIYEVGISYSGRTYKEGKKIGWRDGVRALYVIVRERFRSASKKAPARPSPARPAPRANSPSRG